MSKRGPEVNYDSFRTHIPRDCLEYEIIDNQRGALGALTIANAIASLRFSEISLIFFFINPTHVYIVFKERR